MILFSSANENRIKSRFQNCLKVVYPVYLWLNSFGIYS
ncbi:hypothetical protein PARMER_02610 [Parabacteroides merdae ATCC 43184]|nr:hypothetical protein PARMER_02610 [Parabacteroides merdae ATCC 43184]